MTFHMDYAWVILSEALSLIKHLALRDSYTPLALPL
jgi:hypothetical protein